MWYLTGKWSVPGIERLKKSRIPKKTLFCLSDCRGGDRYNSPQTWHRTPLLFLPLSNLWLSTAVPPRKPLSVEFYTFGAGTVLQVAVFKYVKHLQVADRIFAFLSVLFFSLPETLLFLKNGVVWFCFSSQCQKEKSQLGEQWFWFIFVIMLGSVLALWYGWFTM